MLKTGWRAADGPLGGSYCNPADSAIDRQARDGQAGDRQGRDGQAGDRQARDGQAGDRQAGNRQHQG